MSCKRSHLPNYTALDTAHDLRRRDQCDAPAVTAQQTDTQTHTDRRRAPQYLLRSVSNVAKLINEKALINTIN